MVSRLILSRIVTALITLLVVSMFIFWASEVLPGDIAARVLGRFATAEGKQAFRERLHLDKPVYERYWLWLQGTLHGDFAISLVNERQVWEVVAPQLRNTLLLGGYAFVLYVPISVLLATLSAVFRDRWPDALISFFTLLGLSAPEFVLGTGLLIVLGVAIPIFPVMSLIELAKTPLETIRTLTLPATALAIIMAVYAIRMLRGSLIEVLDSEYVRMATLKGLPRYRVLLWHTLPNALVPTLNVTALNLAYLVGGVVVVEQVFAYPGLGSLLVGAIFVRDAPVIEAIALIASGIYILANLVADVMGVLLNPRLRTG